MALQPIVFSNEMIDMTNSYLSLDSDQYPITDDNGNVVSSIGDFPNFFATSYETYSLTGEVLSAEHGSQSPSIIESYLRSQVVSVWEFAQALADYWGTVLLVPAEPTHGGVSVVSITNDASLKTSSFYDAIVASYSTEWKMPIYNHFINNIESIALPDVTWYITEMMPNGSTATFSEKVF